MNKFLIDTHCHLNMEDFKGEIDQIIDNAKNAGVKYLQTICTQLSEFDEVLALAEKYDNVYCSCGVHPNHAYPETIPSIEKLLELSKHEKVIGLGETGLDYYHPGQDFDAQKIAFTNHIKASSITDIPIIVHSRDAEKDTIDILTEEMKNSPYRGVIHCFTASYDFAKKALDLGLYISVAGIVSFKNAKSLQETISKLPLDRLLVETDAPYLAPTPYRGKRCEPAYTRNTAEFLASLFEIPFEKIQETTTNNAVKLFSKAKFI